MFKTDRRGCRESDWIVCDVYCDWHCNTAAIDEAEGRSIAWMVAMGDVVAASRRVRDVFGLHEFRRALLGHNA